MKDDPLVVCLGESMATLTLERPGSQGDEGIFRWGLEAGEANVARGLVALGVRAAWMSRVGSDGLGRHLLSALSAAGVDTAAVETDPFRNTGLSLEWVDADAAQGPRDDGQVRYRADSAASAMGPGLLDSRAASAVLAEAELLHLSGITAALSDNCLALLHQLMVGRRFAKTISFDLNWRPELWRDYDPAVLRPLLDAADIVLMSAREAEIVLGTAEAARLRELLPGPETLVIKGGEAEAVAIDATGVVAEPALTLEVVGPTGAGDAFAAGYLAGTLQGFDQRRRLRLGHLAAAATLVVPGDDGPPPKPGVIKALLAATPAEWRATRVGSTAIESPALRPWVRVG